MVRRVLRACTYVYRMPFKWRRWSTRAAVSCILHRRATRGRGKHRMKNALLPRVTYHHRVAGTTIFFNVCIFQRFWCYCPRDLRPDSGSFSWKSSSRSLFARFCTEVSKPCWCTPIALYIALYAKKKRKRKVIRFCKERVLYWNKLEITVRERESLSHFRLKCKLEVWDGLVHFPCLSCVRELGI